MEKAREHHSDVFALFVDLKKAYDSVPCPALWRVLEVRGSFNNDFNYII